MIQCALPMTLITLVYHVHSQLMHKMNYLQYVKSTGDILCQHNWLLALQYSLSYSETGNLRLVYQIMHYHLAIYFKQYYIVLLAQSGCASYLESCRLVYEVYFLTYSELCKDNLFVQYNYKYRYKYKHAQLTHFKVLIE